MPMMPRIVSRGSKILEVPKSMTFRLLERSRDSSTRFSGFKSLRVRREVPMDDVARVAVGHGREQLQHHLGRDELREGFQREDFVEQLAARTVLGDQKEFSRVLRELVQSHDVRVVLLVSRFHDLTSCLSTSISFTRLAVST